MKNNIVYFIILCTGLITLPSCHVRPDYSRITSEEGWDSFWSSLDSKQKEFVLSKIGPSVKDTLFDIENIKDLGAHVVEADSAKIFTDLYVAQLDATIRKTESKSVYFEIDNLIKFLSKIENSKSFLECPGGEKGVRFYFAKYPSNYNTIKLRNKTHLIIRLVCNGNDISHFDKFGNPQDVALNYGDVCPPVCMLAPDNTLECKDGSYDIRPPSPILENCPK